MSGSTSRPWTPDVDLSIEKATRLISERFPEIPSPRLELFGRGWDNDAYLVNGELVFRFPRRAAAVKCMQNEIASLPRIADALPLPVPRIRHVALPDGGYPYPFAGYARIAGRTACSVPWGDEERARCAGPLAGFLAALHALPVPDDAPADPAGDKTVAILVEKTLDSLARFEARATSAGAECLRAARKQVLALSSTPDWSGEARWAHGDLYARHLLVDERKRPCGVIDWGDVHAGDAADDLSIAFAFLPASARPEFLDAYGPVDAATADRARLYALHSGALVSAYGWEIGDRVLVEMGRATLKFAAE